MVHIALQYVHFLNYQDTVIENKSLALIARSKGSYKKILKTNLRSLNAILYQHEILSCKELFSEDYCDELEAIYKKLSVLEPFVDPRTCIQSTAAIHHLLKLNDQQTSPSCSVETDSP